MPKKKKRSQHDTGRNDNNISTINSPAVPVAATTIISRNSGGKSITTPKNRIMFSQQSNVNNDKNDNKHENTIDHLPVLFHNNSSDKTTNSNTSSTTAQVTLSPLIGLIKICISEQDANTLHIQSNDLLFVISLQDNANKDDSCSNETSYHHTNDNNNNNNNTSIRNCSIVSLILGCAQIISLKNGNSNNNNKVLSLSPIPIKNNSKNTIPSGMIRIVPSTIIDDIFNKSNNDNDNNEKSTQNRISTPKTRYMTPTTTITSNTPLATDALVPHNTINSPPIPGSNATTTTPSTPFSFRIGGGGDLLYTSTGSNTPKHRQQQQQYTPKSDSVPPHNSSSTSRSKRNDNDRINNSTLLLIPFQTITTMKRQQHSRKNNNNQSIGSILYNKFVQDCNVLVVQSVIDPTTSSSNVDVKEQHNHHQVSGCDKIIKRLIIAHCIGRYVQLNERITISFQGRSLTYRVCTIQGNTTGSSTNENAASNSTTTTITPQHERNTPITNSTSVNSNDNNDIDSVVSNLQTKLNITDTLIGKNLQQQSNDDNSSSQCNVNNSNCNGVGDDNDATINMDNSNNSSTTKKKKTGEEQEQDEECIIVGNNRINISQTSRQLSLYKITYNTNINFHPHDEKLSIISHDSTIPIMTVNDSQQQDDNMHRHKQHTQHSQPQQLVAGLDETIDQVRSFLEPPLFYSHIFTNRGMKPPRGILLYGPSGVGKTSLAQQIGYEIQSGYKKNVQSTTTTTTTSRPTTSTSSNSIQTKPLLSNTVHVQYVHCAEIQSKSSIVGDAERYLSRLFSPTNNEKNSHSSSRNSSKLLILDDIHLICPRRGGPNNLGNTDRLASTLLALMDGINSTTTAANNNNNIVIVGITSNPSVLDAALRRPGRFDAEIEIPLPEDVVTRAKILQFHLNRYNCNQLQEKEDDTTNINQEQLIQLAQLAKGFNGADCMLAIKEAIRMSIIRTTTRLTDDDTTTPAHVQSTVTISDLQTAIRSIRPSAIKSITVEIPKVLWSDIGGMESVKNELRDAIDRIPESLLYKQLNIPKPRGILLYGPPGCSKTLMAKALATESTMNFLAVKGPELLSKWLGESERALASLFKRARMAHPCIIFFDEIDSIACKRSNNSNGGGDGASNRLLSQLLTELDGVNNTNSTAAAAVSSTGTDNNKQQQQQQEQTRVIIVGATNRPDLLDTALTRPGRIDRMIYVGIPDVNSRKQIFQITLQKKSCSNDIDYTILASDTISYGLSGAEIVAICRDASFYSLEETIIIDKSNTDNNNSTNDNEDNTNNTTTTTTTTTTSLPVLQMKHLLLACQSMQRQITPEMLNFYKRYRDGTSTVR